MTRSILRAVLIAAFMSQAAFAQSVAPRGTEQAAPAQDEDAATSGPELSQLGLIAASLPPLVEDVQVVGPWGENGSRGVYRTVMIRDAGDDARAHFFVQQIAGSGANATVASTLEIPEIAAAEGEVVGYNADEPSEADPDGLMLFFQIVPSDGEIDETYQLIINGDGSYEFGPATN